MAKSVRRRKKQRLYWAEIGFLILGLIALRPSLVADLAAMTRPAPNMYYRSVYDDRSAYDRSDYDRGNAYPSRDVRYDDIRFAAPSVPSHHVAYWPQYDARLVPPASNQQNSAWGMSPLHSPIPSTSSLANSGSSGVAWPDAQVHQLVHNGVAAPHVASPTWPISTPNPSYYPYPSTAPGSTGRY